MTGSTNPVMIARIRERAERRRAIVAAYGELKSLRRVAAQFGISHERVRQILAVYRGDA